MTRRTWPGPPSTPSSSRSGCASASSAGELDKLVNRVHGSEVARTEQRLRLEQLEQRALEEFGVEAEALVSEYGPGARPVPTADAEPGPVRTARSRRSGPAPPSGR